MTAQPWRDRYAYVTPQAMQARKLTFHRLPSDGPYYGPHCNARGDYWLVLREHLDRLPGATACRNCWPGES
jgi:hypothetical protein